MEQARDLPLPLRISVAGLGVFLLALALMGAFTLYDTGWRWSHAMGVLVLAVEGIDFVVAASRHRGSWPVAPLALLDLVSWW